MVNPRVIPWRLPGGVWRFLGLWRFVADVWRFPRIAETRVLPGLWRLWRIKV